MSENKRRFRLSPSMQIILGFTVLILLGTFLLALPIANKDGQWLNIVDAFFTSTSMVCSTGLTVMNIAQQFTLFGKIVILLLIQIGGLGIISLTSLILLILKKKFSFSNRMVIKESLNTDTVQGVVAFIKRVLIITFAIEGVGAILLLYSSVVYTGSFWSGLFSAIFMSISAFCNVGVDVYISASGEISGITSFASNVLMLLPIMMIILLGGIGFVVLIGGFKNIRTNQNTKVILILSAILVFGGAGLYMLVEWNNPNTIGNMSTGEKILNSFFQSISSRNAGSTTFNQGGLSTLGQIITIVLMFIGGAPTSVAGGIRVTTFFVILVFLFKKNSSNGAVVYKGKNFPITMLYKALKVLLYTIGIIIISIVLILAIEGDTFSLGSVIFECVSAITTTGFSMGITPMLSVASKIVISIIMFVGRIGMTTLLLGLSTKSDASIEQVEYTNTDIIVG